MQLTCWSPQDSYALSHSVAILHCHPATRTHSRGRQIPSRLGYCYYHICVLLRVFPKWSVLTPAFPYLDNPPSQHGHPSETGTCTSECGGRILCNRNRQCISGKMLLMTVSHSHDTMIMTIKKPQTYVQLKLCNFTYSTATVHLKLQRIITPLVKLERYPNSCPVSKTSTLFWYRGNILSRPPPKSPAKAVLKGWQSLAWDLIAHNINKRLRSWVVEFV